MCTADDLIAAIVDAASDRGALSDELHFAATTERERLAFDHGQANAVRALALPPDAVVLQVGAGHGAVTRYLGETVGHVWAVEEEPRVVRARVHGLGNVDVVANVAEVPALEFDVALVTEEWATPALLGSLRARTVAVLVVDQWGLAEVREALRVVGLPVDRVLTCSPGVDLARAVTTEEIRAEHPRLAATLAPAEPVGHVVLSGAPRWEPGRLATYFNTAERAAWACTRADVWRTADGAEVRRAPLVAAPRRVADIGVRACADVVRDAPTVRDVLLTEPWRAAELLTGWLALLREQEPLVGPAIWDLVPHNVLVDGAVLRPIDLEWEHHGVGVEEVVERGLLVLAHQLGEAGWRGAAERGSTRELARWLGVLVGVDPAFVEGAVAREVDFATIGSCGSRVGTAEIRGAILAVWEQRLDHVVR